MKSPFKTTTRRFWEACKAGNAAEMRKILDACKPDACGKLVYFYDGKSSVDLAFQAGPETRAVLAEYGMVHYVSVSRILALNDLDMFQAYTQGSNMTGFLIAQCAEEGNFEKIVTILKLPEKFNYKLNDILNLSAANIIFTYLVKHHRDSFPELDSLKEKILCRALGDKGATDIALSAWPELVTKPLDSDGNTALHLLVDHIILGHIRGYYPEHLARDLIDAGADPYQENNSGHSAIDLAKEGEHRLYATLAGHAAEDGDDWRILQGNRLARCYNDKAIGRQNVEIFDFDTGLFTAIIRRLDDRSESVSPPVPFTALTPAATRRAIDAFTRIAGHAPPQHQHTLPKISRLTLPKT